MSQSAFSYPEQLCRSCDHLPSLMCFTCSSLPPPPLCVKAPVFPSLGASCRWFLVGPSALIYLFELPVRHSFVLFLFFSNHLYFFPLSLFESFEFNGFRSWLPSFRLTGWMVLATCLPQHFKSFFCFVLFLHRSCWTKADLPGGSAGILAWNPIPICPEQTQQKKCLFIHFKPKKKTSVSLKFVEINNDKREKRQHLILA